MEKAIFINQDRQILKEAEFLDLLKNAEFKIVMIACKSIQPGNFNSRVDAVYYCDHQTECNCRFPRAGLIFEAAQELNLDLKNSWLIGDTLDDIEAANRAGCNNILIANGMETQWQVTPIRQPQYISANFEYAAGTVVLKNIYQMVREQNLS